MTDTKHTPGPWFVEQDNVSFVVKDQDDITVAGTFSRMDDGMEEANAALIAAAPDMYEALQAIADFGGDPQYDYTGAECADIARAALAKAEGR